MHGPVLLPNVALYAAYASNMDPEQMAQRAQHSPLQGTGWLTGWRLTFGGSDVGWDGALATVVEAEGEHVFVALYDVPELDEQAMDAWEGTELGIYTKIRVRIDTLFGEQLAWTYVLNAYEGGLPSARTLGIIADAAEKSGAPEEYCKELRSRPCASLGDEQL
jgi:gamma-glutamylcyclotransferase (GGCT)/AIG2-like uncharacterized protein YtfP